MDARQIGNLEHFFLAFSHLKLPGTYVFGINPKTVLKAYEKEVFSQ